MEMSNQLQTVLTSLIRPAVEYNMQQMAFAGTAFYKNEEGQTVGLLPAPYFIIQLENMGIEPQGEFFHYISNTWGQCPYPVPISEVVRRLTEHEYIGKVVVPFNNLINHLNRMDDKYKKKSRVIISPNELLSGEAIMKFENKGGVKAFERPGKKPFIVSKDSFIPPDVVQPNVRYKCVVAGDTEGAYLMNVIAPYNKVQLGIHYSEHGFFPDNMDMINRLVNIPPDFVMGTNIVEPAQDFRMPAIHLDCTLLYDLIRVFGLINTTFLEIHFGEVSNVPVVIKNMKTNPQDVQISIKMGTLNTFYGAQRR